jgi:hypothetical protein
MYGLRERERKKKKERKKVKGREEIYADNDR